MMRYLWSVKNRVMTGMFVFAAAMFLFVANSLEVHAYIQTQGTVVAESAVIRKDPSANGNVIASIMKGDKVTINNEETDSNGVIWYKVFVDAQTLGYVRGDLIQKEGADAPITNTPTTSTNTSADSGSTSSSNSDINTDVTVGSTTTVTPVQSQGASVTGDTVRVRAEASTNSSIVTQVKKATAITVNGQADGEDGKVWYKVSFIVDGSEVVGFIRSDFVQLTEEIVIIDETTTTDSPEQTETPSETPEENPVEEVVNTDFELKYEANAEGINEWYLYNNVEGVKNKLSELMDAAEGNGDAIETAQEELKKQKTIIIVLAIIIVFMALALTLLFFKIRDMYYDDFDAYDDEPEKPRRSAPEPRTVKPVQGERPAARPQGQRQGNGQSRPGNGQSRPNNGQPRSNNGQPRPNNGQPRPNNGQPRPNNGQPRPNNGQPRPNNGQPRPNNGQPRPNNGQSRPQENVIQPSHNQQQQVTKADAGWKAKNFMAEDDDFEFEFLNWDGDDK